MKKKSLNFDAKLFAVGDYHEHQRVSSTILLNGFKKQISSILCKVSVLLQYSNQESFTPVIVKTKIVLKMDEILQLMKMTMM